MRLDEIVAISNKYGKNHDFVIAGGGNTSCKDETNLFIKGSGVSLANINEKGFVRMEREKLNAIWEKEYSNDLNKVDGEVLTDIMGARGREEYSKRPSVEVLLHDLFPQKFVLHVHPAILNGMTCANAGKEAASRLFGNKAEWIPAMRPGYLLASYAKKVIDKHRLQNGKDLKLMFIENHGVFFAADTVKELDNLVECTMNSVKEVITQVPNYSDVPFDRKKAAALAPAVRMLTRVGNTSIVTFRTNAEIKRLVSSAQSFLTLTSAYTPDQIVYCMDKPLFVEASEDMKQQYENLEEGVKGYAASNNHLPKIVAVEGLGFFACGKDKTDADIAAAMFLDTAKIAAYSEYFGGPKFMDKKSIEFIKNWEVERYRKSVSLGKSSDEISEKIAVVTGGAQGFGKGISEELAAKGFNVVIADLNEKTAAETAGQLAGVYGDSRVMAVCADVADENSTEEMIIQTVLEYGGIDAYINNAGINKPGGLEEMDVATFERINRVNYTAYFLGVKYASRIMKIQHRYAPDIYADIIQINSKSGISGSNKNFAYAGSKFAGIGLTQSFALELVEYNIKVNAICPGNFFESPLWSDPEKGMFQQYLKAGKVPGAKTIEDIKRSYESKVPMKRGCRARDVARAVLYIIEQEYETGQAVPVTGGQQMLK